MKKPRVQQRTERRISAALRLVLVAVLLVAQIALVLLLSTVLKQRAALAYTALELVRLCRVYLDEARDHQLQGGVDIPDSIPAGGGPDALLAVERRAAVQASGPEKAAAAPGVRLQAGREPPEHRKAAAEHAPVGSAGVLSEQ